jgi:hypothetical protein
VTTDGSSPRMSASGTFVQDWAGVSGPSLMLRINSPGVTVVRAVASRGEARSGGGSGGPGDVVCGLCLPMP